MSISVVSADEISSLQAMFPHETQDSLRRALHQHKGDLAATIEALLAGGGPQPTTPTTPPPTTWTCGRCTFDNSAGARRCAMCDAPRDADVGPTPTTPPPKQPGDVVVPPWWSTFWSDHHDELNCDEQTAKELLFTGGQFKNSQILTVDIKNRIFSLLGVCEAHHVEDVDDQACVGFPPPFARVSGPAPSRRVPAKK